MSIQYFEVAVRNAPLNGIQPTCLSKALALSVATISSRPSRNVYVSRTLPREHDAHTDSGICSDVARNRPACVYAASSSVRWRCTVMPRASTPPPPRPAAPAVASAARRILLLLVLVLLLSLVFSVDVRLPEIYLYTLVLSGF